MQIECRKKSKAAAEIKEKDLSLPSRKICDFDYCPV